MIYFYKFSGEITRRAAIPLEDAPLLLQQDEQWIYSDECVDDSTHYVSAGALCAFPSKPGKHYEWSWDTYTWVLTEDALDKAKKNKKWEVDQERNRLNLLPIFYSGHYFDADSVSQNNVMAWMVNISNGLTVPTGFTWRDASNVDHPADEDFITGLGAAMVQRGSQLYQIAWQQKAAIDALTSVAEVDSFTISF